MIPLFYYDNLNLGDSLSPWIVERLSGDQVVYKVPLSLKKILRRVATAIHLIILGKCGLVCKQLSFTLKPIIIAVGSLLEHSTNRCVCWGTGMAQPTKKIQGGRFIMTRGKLSRQVLIEQGFIVESEICGDPALLMPRLFCPNVEPVSGRIGVIPHVSEFETVCEKISKNKNFYLIDFRTKDVSEAISKLLSCEYVYSSSLHGLILCHAYGIPCSWFQINVFKGGDFKFHDHFTAVGISPYKPLTLQEVLEKKRIAVSDEIVEQELIKRIQDVLLSCAPYSIAKL